MGCGGGVARGGMVMTMVEVTIMMKVVSMVVMVVVTTTLKRWSWEVVV